MYINFPQELVDWLFNSICRDADISTADRRLKFDCLRWAMKLERRRVDYAPDAPKEPFGLEVMKMLAVSYADRPGFREEWRPQSATRV